MSASAKVISLFDVLPDESQQFITFWYRYPKRVDKLAAQRAWARLSPADRTQAVESLPAHVAYWQLSGTRKQFIPHPATWLNGRRWEDELADLDTPLTDLGQCDWNRNGTREPGQPRCAQPAVSTAPAGHASAGHCYCATHARKQGLAVPK